MNPVFWTRKRGFYMSKLSYEDKINLYEYNHEDINYKYFNKALNNWYNFSNTIIEDSTSNIYNELRVALMEIININY